MKPLSRSIRQNLTSLIPVVQMMRLEITYGAELLGKLAIQHLLVTFFIHCMTISISLIQHICLSLASFC